MPRKSKKEKKEPKKVKNIIQQVIVKVGTQEKRKSKGRKRPAKKEPKETPINVMANIPPSIIYQQAPSVNIPPAFTTPTTPAPFASPIPKKSLAEIAIMTEPEPAKISIATETEKPLISKISTRIKPSLSLNEPVSIDIPPAFIEPVSETPFISPPKKTSKKSTQTPNIDFEITTEEDLNKSGDPVTAGEFAPTANFTSPYVQAQAEISNNNIYTESVFNQNALPGNETFGISSEQIARDIPTVTASNLPTSTALVVYKAPPKGQPTIEEAFGYTERPIDLEMDIKTAAVKGKSLEKQQQKRKSTKPSTKDVNDAYALRFGTIYENDKKIPKSVMIQRLEEQGSLFELD